MAARLRQESFSGWTRFEAVYILAFLAIQVVVLALNPDNWLSAAIVVGWLAYAQLLVFRFKEQRWLWSS